MVEADHSTREALSTTPTSLRSPFNNFLANDLGAAESGQKDGSEADAMDAPTTPSRGANPAARQLTFRAVMVGLLVGSALCCSNTYFGLQSGWVTMGSLQSAILGFGIFRLLERHCGIRNLSMEENVIVQTTAVATATMPLAAGLVGVIPAFKILEPPEGPVNFSPGQLIVWSLSLAFIGVFSAVPLRTQTILREKLRFPSGTATANVIRTLHAAPEAPAQTSPSPSQLRQRRRPLSRLPEEGGSVPNGVPSEVADEESQPLVSSRESGHLPVSSGTFRSCSGSLDICSARSLLKADSINRHCSLESKLRSMKLPDEPQSSTDFERAWRALLGTFAAAGVYTLASSQWAALRSFPVFSWVGLPQVTAWGWEVAPSMGYIGQGMIMGPKTAISMLLGAITGYGILGPLARSKGWAPRKISDWETGATGWILWISLSIMLADSLTSLAILCTSSEQKGYWRWRMRRQQQAESSGPKEARIPAIVWGTGLLLSGIFCTAVLAPMLHMKAYEPITAVLLALLVAVLAVRALGETDLNPVSGVGKLSQVVFAVIAPRKVVANLAAGAIAEAGAQQAGDMMQDFKTAHLLGVCPRAQFIAMLLGSGASVFVSVGAYLLYTSSYEVPGPQFPAPTAEIWLDMAKLVNGGHLPPNVGYFCIGGAIFGAVLPLLSAALERAVEKLAAQDSLPSKKLKLVTAVKRGLPSGIGFAVGIYVQAKWTIPRVIGSVVEQIWLRKSPKSHASLMIVVASGLVLGEGTASIVAALVKAIHARIAG